MGYYMGDFYRGDPGFWGSLWGGIKGAATGFITGGGPLGAVAGGLKGAIKGSMPGGARPIGAVNQLTLSGAGGRAIVPTRGVMTPARNITTTGSAALGSALAMPPMGGGGGGGFGPTGRHVLKHCHMPLKSGKMGKCHRSMNVCNPRALRRAIRRTRGFAKLAMKTIHIVHPKKKGRFGGFKRRKRG